VALKRVVFVAAVILGIALLSNVARYAGAAFFGATAPYTIYTIYPFGTAHNVVNFQLSGNNRRGHGA
jgi:hypothetical protein